MKHVIFASYGNDSCALIQWTVENGIDGVTCAYSDTGWAAPWWADRITEREAWVKSLGYKTIRIPSEGMESLVRRKKGWPMCARMQFCTQVLKTQPAATWLAKIDPECEVVCMVGIRREESAHRATFPDWTEESSRHGNRSLWAPLARHTGQDRDALLARAGIVPLPHRSMECYPCICSNRADLQAVDDNRVALVEAIEADMGVTVHGKPRTMFRPYRHLGAIGIREVVRWAKTGRAYNTRQPDLFLGGCDSGMCAS